MSNREIRAIARKNLGGNIFHSTWMLSLAVYLVVYIIVSAASTISGIGGLILYGPLTVGMAAYFLALSRSENAKFEKAFSGFANFGDNLLVGLMPELFIFLWSLLFVIPGIVKTYSYSMVYYIKNDHPEYDWKDCINESRRIMNGNKMKLFALHLSFLGWILLSFFTFGIGMLWVCPYMEASNAAFYETIKNK